MLENRGEVRAAANIRPPAETWIQQMAIDLTLDSTQPVTAVTIDPDKVLPDKDRSNDVWKLARGRQSARRPVRRVPSTCRFRRFSRVLYGPVAATRTGLLRYRLGNSCFRAAILGKSL